MNNKLRSFLNTILLSFFVLSVSCVCAIPPESNFPDVTISSVHDVLLSQGIILEKFIACGGNGDVYEAMKEGQKIAIKISKTDTDIRVWEQLFQANIRYSGLEDSEKWLNECCVLPMKVDTELNFPYICSMFLAQCDLVKRNGKSNIKYDYLDIADIIKNAVKGFEALRVRGFYHNDISLENILKMPDATPGSAYRLSDFGAMKQVNSEEEGKIRISQDIKSLVEMLNSGTGFSKGNPIDASSKQREAMKSFKEFYKYVKSNSQISASDVLRHDYIVNYSKS